MKNRPPIPPSWHDPELEPERQANPPLVCPYCHHRFLLSWVHYLRGGPRHYQCPSCRQKSFLLREGWSWMLTAAACIEGGVFVGYICLMLTKNIWFTTIAAILGVLIFGLPVDRYCERHYGKLVAGKGKS